VGVLEDELRQILSQLCSFSESTAPPPLAPAPTSTLISTSLSYNESSYPRPYSPPPSYSNQGPPPGFPVPADRLSYLQQQVNVTSMVPTSLFSVSTRTWLISGAYQQITTLYNALLKTGVMSASATSIGASETANVDESKPKPVDPAKTTSREYNTGCGHSHSWFIKVDVRVHLYTIP
jgi:pre-mRNA cleavage complex 2 protein Pcf11